MSAPVTFTPGTLAPGYCPVTFQQFYNDMIALLTGSIPGTFTTVNYGPGPIDPADQDKPWLRTGAGGEPDRLYFYFAGTWASLHPTPASGEERRLWVGTTAALVTYDGGQVGAVTATSGPMWEVDTTFDGKVPVGVGTLSPSGTVLAVGDTGGVDQLTLTGNQSGLPAHSHEEQCATAGSDAVGGGGANRRTFGIVGSAVPQASGMETISEGPTDAVETHTNMPPYIATYFIKRTARMYYTV